MNEMANVVGKFVFTILILSMTIKNSVSTCPEICNRIKNVSSCLPSSYNISLKESEKHHELQVCCEESAYDPIYKRFVTTYTKVSVRYERLCNSNIVDFNFPTLSANSIYLVNNSISKLTMNVKFNKVREINLSFNELKYINKELFGAFVNLRQLVLRQNQINKISEDSFIGLTKLETLDLSDNRLIELANVFIPLKNLQHLNISRNKLEFLNDNYFNNWLLQHLDISYNNLKIVAPGALQRLPNLARLLLTDNPHLGITQLDTQLLVGTGRRLQQIDAARTGLYQVPEAFTHSVRFLSLVGNNITSIRCGDLDSYPLLQSLDFSDNKISSVEDDSLGRLEMLLFLNINKNYLTVVPKSLPDELKYLSFNDNLIKNLSIPDFKNLPNLKILLIKNNLVSYIEDHVFDDLLSLEMLDLSNNPIKYLSSSTFDGPLSLRDLRLCFLNISMPGVDGSFPMSSPESIQMLHLKSSPGLARQFLSDSAALAAFSHLQYLDLRMNNISEIRNDLLFYLVQLKTFRLHGNNINCSNEIWLNDWMNWNRNSSNNETCYYSTSEAKLEINKYNCTFPETFTISESLPPVNLYSTEMINKLLRYYGYLYNKTEKSPLKRSNDNTKSTITIKYKNASQNNTFQKETIRDIEKANIKSDIEATIYTKQQIINMKLNNTEFPFNNSINNQMPNVKKEIITVPKNKQKINHNEDPKYIESYRPFMGSKLNMESIDHVTNNRKLKIADETVLPEKRSNDLERKIKSEHTPYIPKDNVNAVNADNILEYSPYLSIRSKYAEYTITVGIISLIVVALILWASFRLRFKRRRVQEISSSIEDQIEVSNISGGVLW